MTQKLFTKRERLAVSITAGLGAVSVVFFFLIEPLLKKSGLLNDKIAITRLRLNRYMQLLVRKAAITSKYDRFNFDVNASESDKGRFVAALSTVESYAKTANIRIIDIRPQNVKPRDSNKEIIIDLRTEGDIEGYMKFMHTVENSLSLLRITNCQLDAKPEGQLLDGSFSLSQLSGTE